MNLKTIDIILKIIVSVSLILFCIAVFITDEYKNPKPELVAPTNLTVAIKPNIKFGQFEAFTCIFTYQLPEKSIGYCKCLAATSINQINNSHNKYTEMIYKHNPKTINKGIKIYNDSTEK